MKGGAGEGTEPPVEECEAKVGDERMQLLQAKARERKVRFVETKRDEDEGKDRAGKAGNPLSRKANTRAVVPVRSSRRLRGEPAPDPEEPPPKRRRRL